MLSKFQKILTSWSFRLVCFTFPLQWSIWYLEIPSLDTSLPLEDAVDPNMESHDDERGILLEMLDGLAEDTLPLARSEEELDGSRKEVET